MLAVFTKNNDSTSYTKILFVCFILIVCGRLLIYWRNFQKPQTKLIRFSIFLTEFKSNCLYQAKGKYIFALPNCTSYEVNQRYQVVARAIPMNDNQRFLLKNIDVILFIPIQNNFFLDFFQSNLFARYLRQLHRHMIALIHSTFSRHFSPLSATLATSLVLGGQTSPLSKWQRDEFIALGLAHLVAVSGTHLHLFVFFFQGICLFGKHRRLLGIVTILVAIIFSWLAGNPASALRALLMLIFSLIASNFLRCFSNQFYYLFLSALLMLLLGESYLSGAGLYLSLTATFAVIFAGLMHKDFAYQRAWREQCFQLVYVAHWQKLIFCFCSAIKRLLLTALLVQLLILPVQIFFFNNFNPLSFVASAFFSVLFSFFILSLIVLAVLTLIFGYWWWGQQLILAPLALLIKIPLELTLGFISFIADYFSLFTFSFSAVPWYFYLFYLCLLFTCLFYYSHWRLNNLNYADDSVF